MTENPANLELILSTITDGVLVLDQCGVVLYANQSAEHIFERGDLLGRDLAIPINTSGFQDINLIRSSGIGWAELRSTSIVWKKMPAFVISVRDITERKQSELGLRLADAVFDSTREGLMVTDINNRIVRINPAFSEITGYSETEALGKTPEILHSGRHDAAFYVAMWANIASIGHWQGEIWNRRKNGEVYPELASISTVHDEAGMLCNYVAVFADIPPLKSRKTILTFSPITTL